MTRIGSNIEEVPREWSDRRWVLLEPKWLVARHLLSGGWSWRTPDSINRQLRLLDNRIPVAVENTPRHLIVCLQNQNCLRSLIRGWGITPSNERSAEIKGSKGYQRIVGYLADVDDEINRLVGLGIDVKTAALAPSTYARQWRGLEPEAQEAVLRDLFKTLESTVRKIHRSCSATWKASREAALRHYPEIETALIQADVGIDGWIADGQRQL